MTHLLLNTEDAGPMRAACGAVFADQREVQLVGKAGAQFVDCAECRALIEGDVTEVIQVGKA